MPRYTVVTTTTAPGDGRFTIEDKRSLSDISAVLVKDGRLITTRLAGLSSSSSSSLEVCIFVANVIAIHEGG